MTSSKRPKIQTPVEPDPLPTPIPGREEDEAKKKLRRRMKRTGREGTILAGRLTAQRGGILNIRLG